ncbi:hypothetical protein D3C72_1203380 [compost metagenome]
MTRRQIGVVGARAATSVLPAVVHAGQAVAVAVALGPRERQRDIIDLQLGRSGRQAQPLLQGGLGGAIQHVADAHPGRHGVDVRLQGVQPRQALVGCQPQQAVGGQHGGRDGATLQGNAGHAIDGIEQARGDWLAVAQCAAQGGGFQPYQTAAAVEPEPPMSIADHAGNAFEDAGGVGAHGQEVAVAEARGQARLTGNQQ